MHILSNISTSNLDRLTDMSDFLKAIDKVIEGTGVQDLGRVTHKFPDDSGYTIVVCLAESHIAVHTWPELGKVTLDVYLCNYLHDNTSKCESIYASIEEYFQPDKAEVTRIDR
jgi:S-adenosylmethionine decarboxylase